MKDNFKLIVITTAFVLMGLLLAFISLKREDLETLRYCVFDGTRFTVNEEIVGYRKGSFCVCSEGGIVECIPLNNEIANQPVVLEEDLRQSGLKFEYSYVMGVGENGDDLIFDTNFTNIAIDDENLIITLEQMQICSGANSVFEQEGFYEEVNGVVKLYNKIESDEGISCIVELKYTIEDFDEFNLGEISIMFVNANGVETVALMCIYDEIIYFDNDVFKNEEGLICLCDAGNIVCDEDLSD